MRSNLRLKIWYVLFLSFPLLAAVGDYSSTRNLPGYINLNSHSATFVGPFLDAAHSKKGLATKTPSQILFQFLSGQRISQLKIREVITDILRYRENVRIAFCQVVQARKNRSQVGCKDGFPSQAVEVMWSRDGKNQGLRYAIERLEEAIVLSESIQLSKINTLEAQDFLEALFDGLEIYHAALGEDIYSGSTGGIGRILGPLRYLRRTNQITNGRVEASNLMKNSSEQIFYSPIELAQMSKSGEDISLLHPKDSGFWRMPTWSIDQYQTNNYNYQEIPYLQGGLISDQVNSLIQPAEAVDVVYDLGKGNLWMEDSRLVVRYGNMNFEIKVATDRTQAKSSNNAIEEGLRVVRGMESNSDVVASNLAAALGYSVDGVYHKSKVRLFFNSDVYSSDTFDGSYQKFLTALDQNFGLINNVRSAFKFVKEDPATGRKYIELKNIQLEQVENQQMEAKVGSFARRSLGKALKREHRAFAIFLAWVWDTDPSDTKTSLKLLPYQDVTGKFRYHLVMSNSDMGSTLASSRPNFFNFDLVRNVQHDPSGELSFLSFNFWRVTPFDLMKAVTFADAKWIARLIAQLTPEQILNANLAAGYPEVVAKYYTGLLINKRNQLLSALDLIGETFTNHLGKSVTIDKLPAFEETIEHYEEFFEDGYLVDADNQLFDQEVDHYPRYWGANFSHAQGGPQEYYIKLLKMMTINNASNAVFKYAIRRATIGISSDGLVFKTMSLANTGLARECASKCFFQGIQVGIQDFIPWRFLVNNPDPEARAPFLIVDLFRFGFYGGVNLQHNFGVDISGALTMGIGAQHTQVSEYIKLTPVSSIEEFFNNKPNPFVGPKLNLLDARKKIFRSLKENEVLIQSHYIGNKAEAELRLDNGVLGPITPTMSIKGKLVSANRVTFMGKNQSEVYAAWENLANSTSSLVMNLRFSFVRIPLLKYEIKKLRSNQRTFKFDVSKPEDRNILERNFNRVVPDKIPSEYALRKRTSRIQQKKFSLGFFRIYQRTRAQRTIRVDFEDYENDLKASSLSFVRESQDYKTNRYLGRHHVSYKVQASLNSRNEMYAKVKFFGRFSRMTRIYFKNLLYNYSGLLPANFIQFDPDSVKDNFGTFEFDVESIFPEKGLKEIFDPRVTKFGMCKVYVGVNDTDWNENTCAGLSRKHFVLLGPFSRGLKEKKAFLKFWRNYAKARAYFWKLSSPAITALSDRYILDGLKKIVESLVDKNKYESQSMNMFIALSSPKNYFRQVSMLSTRNAFPGGYDAIVQNIAAKGKFQPTLGMLSDNPEEEFELFTDMVHLAVDELFWNRKGAYDILPNIL